MCLSGLVSGLITAGFGLGSVIFAPLQQYLLNPSGVPPTWGPYEGAPKELYYNDPTILDRVPSVFPYLAAAYLSLVLVSICLICNPTAESEKKQGDAVVQQQQEKQKQLRLSVVLKSPPFLLLWGMFLLEGISIIFLASFWKPLAAAAAATGHQHLSETQLAAVGAAGSAANALGRILWGKYADMKTFQHALVCRHPPPPPPDVFLLLLLLLLLLSLHPQLRGMMGVV